MIQLNLAVQNETGFQPNIAITKSVWKSRTPFAPLGHDVPPLQILLCSSTDPIPYRFSHGRGECLLFRLYTETRFRVPVRGDVIGPEGCERL